MKLLRSCALAFAMYSRLPMPRLAWTEENLSLAFCFFPGVGAAVGLLLALWAALAQWLGLGAAVTAAGCLAVPLLVTGGIHLDGFCDTADALASHQSRERKLEILKDSHVGAFALMACAVCLIAQFALWQEAELSGRALWVLALVPVYSRAWSGLGVVTMPNARGQGMLATFSDAADGTWVRAVLAAVLSASAAGMVWLSPAAGGAAAAAGVLVFCYYRWKARREFGGITGDLAGWFLQLCELGCLLAVVLAQKGEGLL